MPIDGGGCEKCAGDSFEEDCVNTDFKVEL